MKLSTAALTGSTVATSAGLLVLPPAATRMIMLINLGALIVLTYSLSHRQRQAQEGARRLIRELHGNPHIDRGSSRWTGRDPSDSS